MKPLTVRMASRASRQLTSKKFALTSPETRGEATMFFSVFTANSSSTLESSVSTTLMVMVWS